jgi:hypothetical protein
MNTSIIKVVAITAISVLSLSAFASPECTNEPRNKWMAQSDVKTKLESQGYTVKRVETDDSCYEVYAQTKDGKRVELHVNPVDAKIIEEEDDS